MNVVAGSLPGVLIFEPPSFPDTRGMFRELYRAPRYADAGLTEPFVQDNLSRSVRHTLRGLHLQNPGAHGKLVMVLEGAVYDVAVDVRRESPTFACWEGFELNAENGRQAYLPPGFAHGFLVLSDSALGGARGTRRGEAVAQIADGVVVDDRDGDPRHGFDVGREQTLARPASTLS
ncbi:MAG: dTDP-4-dehydrorhamnose 3,5-epimerase family protein [Gemmatimonadaceae bacterium]|nr:dTDP-4-dehydrorhamnose 3,5-epimerase family protein [Gemmatimonadaceae bacterium]